jgi:thiosulfate dehydrogenase (quinone) large subunit
VHLTIVMTATQDKLRMGEIAMETESDVRERRTAYALLRIVVGVNLVMHGVSRIISGPGEFAAKLVIQFTHAPIPAWSVWGFALTLPSIESILGLLILIGLRTRAALIAAALLIVVLTFGSSIVQDWNAAGIQLTYALAYSALLFLRRYNGWSIEAWLQRNKQSD